MTCEYISRDIGDRVMVQAKELYPDEVEIIFRRDPTNEFELLSVEQARQMRDELDAAIAALERWAKEA